MGRRGLDAKDRQLLRLRLEQSNLKVADLCKLVGLGRTAVSTRLNRPAFKRAFTKAWLRTIDRLIEERVASHEAARRR